MQRYQAQSYANQELRAQMSDNARHSGHYPGGPDIPWFRLLLAFAVCYLVWFGITKPEMPGGEPMQRSHTGEVLRGRFTMRPDGLYDPARRPSHYRRPELERYSGHVLKVEPEGLKMQDIRSLRWPARKAAPSRHDCASLDWDGWEGADSHRRYVPWRELKSGVRLCFNADKYLQIDDGETFTAGEGFLTVKKPWNGKSITLAVTSWR